jgi:hypothetical protein
VPERLSSTDSHSFCCWAFYWSHWLIRGELACFCLSGNDQLHRGLCSGGEDRKRRQTRKYVTCEERSIHLHGDHKAPVWTPCVDFTLPGIRNSIRGWSQQIARAGRLAVPLSVEFIDSGKRRPIGSFVCSLRPTMSSLQEYSQFLHCRRLEASESECYLASRHSGPAQWPSPRRELQ